MCAKIYKAAHSSCIFMVESNYIKMLLNWDSLLEWSKLYVIPLVLGIITWEPMNYNYSPIISRGCSILEWWLSNMMYNEDKIEEMNDEKSRSWGNVDEGCTKEK